MMFEHSILSTETVGKKVYRIIVMFPNTRNCLENAHAQPFLLLVCKITFGIFFSILDRYHIPRLEKPFLIEI